MSQPFLFVSDFQAPFHDLGCVAITLEYIKCLKPDHLWLGGDILDCFTISSFDRGPKAKYTQLKTEWEVSDREVVAPIHRVSKEANKNVKTIWIEGNHEFRLRRLYSKLQRADLLALFDFIPSIEDFFQLKERHIQYLESKAGNKVHDVTQHLTIMHGQYAGANPPKMHLDKWGQSLIHGHTHKAGTWSQRFGSGVEKVAYSSGCLCKSPDWLDIDQWTRGFVVGEVDEKDGKFSADHEKILISGKHRRELRSRVFGHFIATEDRDGKWTVRRTPAGHSKK